MLIDLTCPVENQGTIVKTNSQTNEPYLLLKLFNLSEKTIAALSFCVLVYDANGTELCKIPVVFEDLSAEPKTFFAENKAVSLAGIEGAKHFVVQVESAKFDDGTEYVLSEENVVEVDETSASIDDALLLRKFAEDAVCFSSERSTYWRCVCGRANLPASEKCARCGKNKNDVLEKFSSMEALQETIDKTMQEEAEKTAMEEARIAEEKAAKAKKTKKALSISGIAVLIAVLLAIAGFFVSRVVLNSMADKAAQQGDYNKAYELYQKTGNKKIADVMQYVQGNTPANLLFQSGLITADDTDNYYLAFNNTTYTFELIQENKTTKETKLLAENAGGSLNVTKDWIYYIDAETSYIKRVSKDGLTTETVLETTASYLSVIGNTLYFIQTDYDNPNNLPEEQCAILATQGQMKTFMHLYSMDIDSKKTALVSGESMRACYIYAGRIYYLTDSDSEWDAYNLCSMDMNGKDMQTVVNSPVSSFVIQNDNLYYIQMYDEKAKGQELDYDSLSYTIIRKNLTDGSEKVLAKDYMATYLNINSDKLFFIALDRSAFFSSLSGDAEATAPTMSLFTMDLATENIVPLVSGEVSIFNVMDDEVIMYFSAQGMCRVKADGTGFQEIKPFSSLANELNVAETDVPVENEEVPVPEVAE